MEDITSTRRVRRNECRSRGKRSRRSSPGLPPRKVTSAPHASATRRRRTRTPAGTRLLSHPAPKAQSADLPQVVVLLHDQGGTVPLSQTFETQFGGRTLTIETGKLARLAAAAQTQRLQDTNGSRPAERGGAR